MGNSSNTYVGTTNTNTYYFNNKKEFEVDWEGMNLKNNYFKKIILGGVIIAGLFQMANGCKTQYETIQRISESNTVPADGLETRLNVNEIGKKRINLENELRPYKTMIVDDNKVTIYKQ